MWKCLFAEETNSGLKVHVLHLLRINEYAKANYVKRETVIWVNQVKIVNNLKIVSKKNHVTLVTQYMAMFDSLVLSILTFYYIRNFYKPLWFDVNQTWMPNGSCILSSELIKSCWLSCDQHVIVLLYILVEYYMSCFVYMFILFKSCLRVFYFIGNSCYRSSSKLETYIREVVFGGLSL